MEEEIKEKALEGVDGFFTKLIEAADIITAKLIAVAPEAADAILNLVQFKGIYNLLLSIIFLCLCCFVIVNSIKFVTNVNPEVWGEGYYRGVYGDCAQIILRGGSVIIMFFSAIKWAIPQLLNFYNWLSAFYPEGAIALKALQAVGIDL